MAKACDKNQKSASISVDRLYCGMKIKSIWLNDNFIITFFIWDLSMDPHDQSIKIDYQ